MNIGKLGQTAAARVVAARSQSTGTCPLVNMREIPGLVFQDDNRPEVQQVIAARKLELALPPAERCRAQVLRGWNVTDEDFAAMSPDAAKGLNDRIDAEVVRRMQISARTVHNGYGLDPSSLWYTYGTVPPTASTVDLLHARMARAGP